ncbi:MAG: hypothetical protein QG599_1869 [Pseudomonadota bacterium]|nr:hypothetical protein [Pseudomonadota bacterium]
MKKSILVLDACVVIAGQCGEVGADYLFNRIGNEGVDSVIHAINVCEIYYDNLRRNPDANLNDLLDELDRWEVRVEHTIDSDLIHVAGELKAYWRRISLADCIAVALAKTRGGILLTTDHHELDPLAKQGMPIEFIR